LAVLISCSVDRIASGNGSETTNGIVSLTHEDGTKAVNTAVTLIPINFNPVTDMLLDSMTKTTDSAGTCVFTLQGSDKFNIQAVHLDERTRFLTTGIQGDFNKDNIYINGTLKKVGTINILMPDTVDTTFGNIYFNGTKIKEAYSDGFSKVGGYYSLTFDSVPPCEKLPQLFYCEWPQGNVRIEITNTLSLNSLDTLSIAFTENMIKPVWRFSLTVAVKTAVSNYYNGLDNIKVRIDNQIDEALRKFNKTDLFDAVIQFSADSIYEFNSDIPSEGRKPVGRFHYRLLYSDEYTAPPVYDTILRKHYIYLYDTPADLFDDWARDCLAYLFGDLRGAFMIGWMDVDASNNAVNNDAFDAPNTIMNSPVGADEWDPYNVRVINYNKTTYKNEKDVLSLAFPDKMGVIVKSSTGETITNAAVNVYVSEFNSGSVNNNPLLAGTTDSNGKYLFTDNPYKPDGSDKVINGILLISATYENNTTYTWLPMTEAGNAYFANPDTTLYKEVSF
jgi:hypothetical protein